MRVVWLGLVLAACTPGEDGDAFVLADDRAADVPLWVDDAPADASQPLRIASGSVVRTDDEQVEVGPDEVVLVRGGRGALDLYTLGVDLEPDRIAVHGPEAVVLGLAEELGLEVETAADGWRLLDPDVWPVLADADPPERPLVFRPVSADDLPGTAPIGDPGHPRSAEPRRAGGAFAALLGVGTADDDVGREAALARRRASALFDLPAGEPVLPSGDDDRVRRVGRYCAGDRHLTLGVNGRASDCRGGRCETRSWAVVDGELLLDGAASPMERQGDGWVVSLGSGTWTDLVLGGCE